MLDKGFRKANILVVFKWQAIQIQYHLKVRSSMTDQWLLDERAVRCHNSRNSYNCQALMKATLHTVVPPNEAVDDKDYLSRANHGQQGHPNHGPLLHCDNSIDCMQKSRVLVTRVFARLQPNFTVSPKTCVRYVPWSCISFGPTKAASGPLIDSLRASSPSAVMASARVLYFFTMAADLGRTQPDFTTLEA